MKSKTTISQSLFVLYILILVVFITQTHAQEDNPNCIISPKSIKDSLFASQFPVCPLIPINDDPSRVIEGDEVSLQKALNMVHKNAGSYVIVLFYAYWCPFSTAFRPKLSVMASLYPSISHLAIEESVIRPSTLSKYGVYGFPTLFVLNSTTRVRYHGSRSIGSLMAFYTSITGIKPKSINETSLGETIHEHEKPNIRRLETYPFSWAESPENMLQQETYLTLATIFVVLRLFYLSYPFIMTRARASWRTRNLKIRLKSLWEHPLLYVNRAIHLFASLTEPCKRSNLRGAMNAKDKAAWASKSVSFGEASTSRDGV